MGSRPLAVRLSRRARPTHLRPGRPGVNPAVS